jgi:hypothetical protein
MEAVDVVLVFRVGKAWNVRERHCTCCCARKCLDLWSWLCHMIDGEKAPMEASTM